MKLVLVWIEIHKDELMADWELANHGETIFKIDPLKSGRKTGDFSVRRNTNKEEITNESNKF